MATHSSILAQRIPWTEEPGGLQPMGSKESDTSEHFQLSGASICFSPSQVPWGCRVGAAAVADVLLAATPSIHLYDR